MNPDLIPDWLSFDAVRGWLIDAGRFVRFWGPIVGLPGLASPASLLGSVLGLLILSGAAVAGLATFISAALLLYLLLTEVFGVSIDFALA